MGDTLGPITSAWIAFIAVAGEVNPGTLVLFVGTAMREKVKHDIEQFISCEKLPPKV
jgi:hypothetical protein